MGKLEDGRMGKGRMKRRKGKKETGNIVKKKAETNVRVGRDMSHSPTGVRGCIGLAIY